MSGASWAAMVTRNTCTGAYTALDTTGGYPGGGGKSAALSCGESFSAEKSNPIYSKSSTVQPVSMIVQYLIKY